jgi:acyl CoA:acetate/3-ketoacid CoA transferase beta subunit
VVTELGVFGFDQEGFVLLERAPGVSTDYIRDKTLGHLSSTGQEPEIQWA